LGGRREYITRDPGGLLPEAEWGPGGESGAPRAWRECQIIPGKSRGPDRVPGKQWRSPALPWCWPDFYASAGLIPGARVREKITANERDVFLESPGAAPRLTRPRQPFFFFLGRNPSDEKPWPGAWFNAAFGAALRSIMAKQYLRERSGSRAKRAGPRSPVRLKVNTRRQIQVRQSGRQPNGAAGGKSLVFRRGRRRARRFNVPVTFNSN